MSVAVATGVCQRCGEPFELRAPHQIFCQERCRYRARDAGKPSLVIATRERCRRWYESRTGKTPVPQPWLYGPPPHEPHLPGGGFEMHVSPPPKWPVEHRNIRALHGLITQLIGKEHDAHVPSFTLLPWPRGIGWGVWIRDIDDARRLAGKTHSGRLFDQRVTIRCSPLHRVASPSITNRGRRRVRIDAITPVVIRSMGSTVFRTDPTAGNVCSTLASWMPPRIGITIAQDSVRVDLVESATQAESVQLGGKYGVVRGFVGHLVVETNAVGHWLLKAAETVGLGGRTALGFGRVRVSDG